MPPHWLPRREGIPVDPSFTSAHAVLESELRAIERGTRGMIAIKLPARLKANKRQGDRQSPSRPRGCKAGAGLGFAYGPLGLNRRLTVVQGISDGSAVLFKIALQGRTACAANCIPNWIRLFARKSEKNGQTLSCGWQDSATFRLQEIQD
jgi:hypothetical protein